MSISIFGILAIAALFFAVTMVLAVGPLLLCRVFAGSGNDECRPQPRRSSLASGVLTVFSTVIGLGIGLFMMYFTMRSATESPARVVHTKHEGFDLEPAAHVSGPVPQFTVPGDVHVPPEHHPHLPIEVVEHSLFVEPPPPPQHVTLRTDVSGVRFVVMALMLVIAAVSFSSRRFRSGLVQAVPVLLAVGLLGALFSWTAIPTQVVDHQIVEHSATTAVHPPSVVKAPLPGEPWQQPRQVTLSAQSTRQLEGQSITVPKEQAAPEDSSTGQAASSEPSEPPVLAYVGTSAAGTPREALPKWVHQSANDAPIRVIDSGMHATVKLAEEHALQELKTLLRSEMVQREPQAAGWQPADQVLLNGGNILQRAVERTQIQVGENSIPMYEAYWQVDLGRLDPLYQAWRPSVVQQRLIRIGGGLALAMLLLGTIAGVLRVDEQTGGQRRKSLAAGTLALWAFVAGIALFVA